MPRNIPPALATLLDDHSTTLCYLLKVVPREAAQFAITTANRDVTYDDGAGAITYRAKRGYTASDTETKSDLSVNNAEADGLLAEYPADGVTQEGIARGDYDGAAYMHYLVDYEHPEAGHVLLGAGTVGRVTSIDNLTMKLEMRSLTQTLKQASMIELTSITCRAKFGDSRCKMPLVWASGIVAEVGDEADRTFYADPAPIEAAVFATGDGSATQFQLKDANGNAVTSGFAVDSIHQTDWQGRVELSSAPRTSLAANSGNPMNWNAGGTTKTAYNDYVFGNDTFHSIRAASGGDAFNGVYTTFAAAAGKTYILSWLLSAGTSGLAQLVAWSAGKGTSILNGTVGALAPGIQSAGALSIIDQIEVDTDVWLVRAEFACAYDDAAMRLLAGPRTATEGDDVIVLGGWAEQADKPGVYIPTTTAPVTVTDYTVDDTGEVTLGQPLADGGTLDWTGGADLPSAEGHFVPGVVHWDTGGNAGRENEVDTYERTSDGTQVSFVIPTHANIQIGDTFSIRQDCNKSRDMCRDRYHNVVNFRGEPDLPRGDAASIGAPKP